MHLFNSWGTRLVQSAAIVSSIHSIDTESQILSHINGTLLHCISTKYYQVQVVTCV
jgi:hypothetical protein